MSVEEEIEAIRMHSEQSLIRAQGRSYAFHTGFTNQARQFDRFESVQNNNLAGVLPKCVSISGRERKRLEAPPTQQSYITRMSAQRIDNALDTIASGSN
jgi:hypothetical protein